MLNIKTDFKNCKRKSDTTVIRKAKKKCFNGISFPTDIDIKRLNSLLAEKISNGEYTIGTLVVPKTYKKLVLKDGIVNTELFTLNSRKINLAFIRKSLIQKHAQFMKCFGKDYTSTSILNIIEYLKSINEFVVTDCNDTLRQKFLNFTTTRHLQMWHDASCLSNHGFILFTVNALYDPAVYYSDTEYKQITGKTINIQSEVEKPQLHIIGRCRSNDEQLAYIETRIECLKELSEGIEWNGVLVNDIMRVFHGDGPAAQLEAGQQKGGHYFCPTCGIHASRCNDIAHAYYLPSFTYQQRFDKVMEGKISQSRTTRRQFKPFEKLSAALLKTELKSRKLSSVGNKSELSLRLQSEMKGMNRVPALCYHDPSATLDDLNLHRYEVATLEPMHDMAGEIINITHSHFGRVEI